MSNDYKKHRINFAEITLTEQEKKSIASAKSIICNLCANHGQTWTQRMTVTYSNIPLEDMKLLFEIQNLAAGEYAKAVEDDEDEPFAKLYGEADEIQAAREKMRKQRDIISNEDLVQIGSDEEYHTVAEIIEQDPARYDKIRQYVDEDDNANTFLEHVGLRPLFEVEYFWVDMTRVSEKHFYNYVNQMYNGHSVMELFAPGKLPFDLEDLNTSSMFGTNKFEALAVLG